MVQAARIIVVGGGIGGLAAANALARVGFEVTVYERATELREVGAALGMQTNAVRALRAIGRAESVLERGVEVKRYEGYSLGRDRLLVAWDQAEVSRRLGEPTLVAGAGADRGDGRDGHPAQTTHSTCDRCPGGAEAAPRCSAMPPMPRCKSRGRALAWLSRTPQCSRRS